MATEIDIQETVCLKKGESFEEKVTELLGNKVKQLETSSLVAETVYTPLETGEPTAESGNFFKSLSVPMVIADEHSNAPESYKAAKQGEPEEETTENEEKNQGDSDGVTSSQDAACEDIEQTAEKHAAAVVDFKEQDLSETRGFVNEETEDKSVDAQEASAREIGSKDVEEQNAEESVKKIEQAEETEEIRPSVEMEEKKEQNGLLQAITSDACISTQTKSQIESTEHEQKDEDGAKEQDVSALEKVQDKDKDDTTSTREVTFEGGLQEKNEHSEDNEIEVVKAEGSIEKDPDVFDSVVPNTKEALNILEKNQGDSDGVTGSQYAACKDIKETTEQLATRVADSKEQDLSVTREFVKEETDDKSVDEQEASEECEIGSKDIEEQKSKESVKKIEQDEEIEKLRPDVETEKRELLQAISSDACISTQTISQVEITEHEQKDEEEAKEQDPNVLEKDQDKDGITNAQEVVFEGGVQEKNHHSEDNEHEVVKAKESIEEDIDQHKTTLVEESVKNEETVSEKAIEKEVREENDPKKSIEEDIDVCVSTQTTLVEESIEKEETVSEEAIEKEVREEIDPKKSIEEDIDVYVSTPTTIAKESIQNEEAVSEKAIEKEVREEKDPKKSIEEDNDVYVSTQTTIVEESIQNEETASEKAIEKEVREENDPKKSIEEDIDVCVSTQTTLVEESIEKEETVSKEAIEKEVREEIDPKKSIEEDNDVYVSTPTTIAEESIQNEEAVSEKAIEKEVREEKDPKKSIEEDNDVYVSTQTTIVEESIQNEETASEKAIEKEVREENDPKKSIEEDIDVCVSTQTTLVEESIEKEETVSEEAIEKEVREEIDPKKSIEEDNDVYVSTPTTIAEESIQNEEAVSEKAIEKEVREEKDPKKSIEEDNDVYVSTQTTIVEESIQNEETASEKAIEKEVREENEPKNTELEGLETSNNMAPSQKETPNMLEKDQGHGDVASSQEAPSVDVEDTSTLQHVTTVTDIKEQDLNEKPREFTVEKTEDKLVDAQEVSEEYEKEAKEDIEQNPEDIVKKIDKEEEAEEIKQGVEIDDKKEQSELLPAITTDVCISAPTKSQVEKTEEEEEDTQNDDGLNEKSETPLIKEVCEETGSEKVEYEEEVKLSATTIINNDEHEDEEKEQDVNVLEKDDGEDDVTSSHDVAFEKDLQEKNHYNVEDESEVITAEKAIEKTEQQMPINSIPTDVCISTQTGPEEETTEKNDEVSIKSDDVQTMNSQEVLKLSDSSNLVPNENETVRKDEDEETEQEICVSEKGQSGGFDVSASENASNEDIKETSSGQHDTTEAYSETAQGRNATHREILVEETEGKSCDAQEEIKQHDDGANNEKEEKLEVSVDETTPSYSKIEQVEDAEEIKPSVEKTEEKDVCISTQIESQEEATKNEENAIEGDGDQKQKSDNPFVNEVSEENDLNKTDTGEERQLSDNSNVKTTESVDEGIEETKSRDETKEFTEQQDEIKASEFQGGGDDVTCSQNESNEDIKETLIGQHDTIVPHVEKEEHVSVMSKENPIEEAEDKSVDAKEVSLELGQPNEQTVETHPCPSKITSENLEDESKKEETDLSPGSVEDTNDNTTKEGKCTLEHDSIEEHNGQDEVSKEKIVDLNEATEVEPQEDITPSTSLETSADDISNSEKEKAESEDLPIENLETVSGAQIPELVPKSEESVLKEECVVSETETHSDEKTEKTTEITQETVKEVREEASSEKTELEEGLQLSDSSNMKINEKEVTAFKDGDQVNASVESQGDDNIASSQNEVSEEKENVKEKDYNDKSTEHDFIKSREGLDEDTEEVKSSVETTENTEHVTATNICSSTQIETTEETIENEENNDEKALEYDENEIKSREVVEETKIGEYATAAASFEEGQSLDTVTKDVLGKEVDKSDAPQEGTEQYDDGENDEREQKPDEPTDEIKPGVETNEEKDVCISTIIESQEEATKNEENVTESEGNDLKTKSEEERQLSDSSSVKTGESVDEHTEEPKSSDETKENIEQQELLNAITTDDCSSTQIEHAEKTTKSEENNDEETVEKDDGQTEKPESPVGEVVCEATSSELVKSEEDIKHSDSVSTIPNENVILGKEEKLEKEERIETSEVQGGEDDVTSSQNASNEDIKETSGQDDTTMADVEEGQGVSAISKELIIEEAAGKSINAEEVSNENSEDEIKKVERDFSYGSIEDANDNTTKEEKRTSEHDSVEEHNGQDEVSKEKIADSNETTEVEPQEDITPSTSLEISAEDISNSEKEKAKSEDLPIEDLETVSGAQIRELVPESEESVLKEESVVSETETYSDEKTEQTTEINQEHSSEPIEDLETVSKEQIHETVAKSKELVLKDECFTSETETQLDEEKKTVTNETVSQEENVENKQEDVCNSAQIEPKVETIENEVAIDKGDDQKNLENHEKAQELKISELQYCGDVISSQNTFSEDTKEPTIDQHANTAVHFEEGSGVNARTKEIVSEEVEDKLVHAQEASEQSESRTKDEKEQQPEESVNKPVISCPETIEGSIKEEADAGNKEIETEPEAENQADRTEDRNEKKDEVVLTENVTKELEQPKEQNVEEIQTGLTETISEKTENEITKKDEDLSHDSIELINENIIKEEKCFSDGITKETEISTLEHERVEDQNDSQDEVSTEKHSDLNETIAVEPQEDVTPSGSLETSTKDKSNSDQPKAASENLPIEDLESVSDVHIPEVIPRSADSLLKEECFISETATHVDEEIATATKEISSDENLATHGSTQQPEKSHNTTEENVTQLDKVGEIDSLHENRDVKTDVTQVNQLNNAEGCSETVKDVILTEEIEQVPLKKEKEIGINDFKEEIVEEDKYSAELEEKSAQNQKEIVQEISYSDSKPVENPEVTEENVEDQIGQEDLQVKKDISCAPRSLEDAATAEPQVNLSNIESTAYPSETEKLATRALESDYDVQIPEVVVDSEESKAKEEYVVLETAKHTDGNNVEEHDTKVNEISSAQDEKRENVTEAPTKSDEAKSVTEENLEIHGELGPTSESVIEKDQVSIETKPQPDQSDITCETITSDQTLESKLEQHTSGKGLEDIKRDVEEDVTFAPENEIESPESQIETTKDIILSDEVAVEPEKGKERNEIKQQASEEDNCPTELDNTSTPNQKELTNETKYSKPMPVGSTGVTEVKAESQTVENIQAAQDLGSSKASSIIETSKVEMHEDTEQTITIIEEVKDDSIDDIINEAQGNFGTEIKDAKSENEAVEDVIINEVLLEDEKAKESKSFKGIINEEAKLNQLTSNADEVYQIERSSIRPNELLEAKEDPKFIDDDLNVKDETFTSMKGPNEDSEIVASEFKKLEDTVTDKDKETLDEPQADDSANTSYDSVLSSTEKDVEAKSEESRGHGDVLKLEEKQTKDPEIATEVAEIVPECREESAVLVDDDKNTKDPKDQPSIEKDIIDVQKHEINPDHETKVKTADVVSNVECSEIEPLQFDTKEATLEFINQEIQRDQKKEDESIEVVTPVDVKTSTREFEVGSVNAEVPSFKDATFDKADNKTFEVHESGKELLKDDQHLESTCDRSKHIEEGSGIKQEPLELNAPVTLGTAPTEDLKISQKYVKDDLIKTSQTLPEIQTYEVPTGTVDKQSPNEPETKESKILTEKIDSSHEQGEPIAKSLIPKEENLIGEKDSGLTKDQQADKHEHGESGVKTDEEEEDDEEEENEDDERMGSCSDAPVMVEASKDIEVKAHKKSHNILSGVGSKVKHSIAKVKKAITGKSPPKSSSPKAKNQVTG
ncbi:hypothetical protein QVD17_09641 [Tagetes erecta]|uniref:Uncharacterized protein n=1 Tax=Tagetes erecta TaxID=13708 RepID=A0AAD8L478_TARER|nr:hypothetical protein QVD17_09641 [Tagetes erecta]